MPASKIGEILLFHAGLRAAPTMPHSGQITSMITLADLLRGLPGTVGLRASRSFVEGIRPNGQLLNMPPRLRQRIRRPTHLRGGLVRRRRQERVRYVYDL